MASGITLLSQPASYTPVYSPAWWTASSSNTAQPNFMYTVVFTDLITSATITKQYEQRPSDAKLVFDSNFFADAYTLNYIPNNVYGFKRCTDAIRKIRINIGETYDIATVSTYTAGSNVDYIVWNGILTDLEYPSYATSTYIYKSTTVNYVYLSNNKSVTSIFKNDGITYADKSAFLYCISSENQDLQYLTIYTYNAANALIGTSYIANPYTGGTTYTDKYVCIDIGHKGLSHISAGLVTGTYPIMTASVDRYEVWDSNTLVPLVPDRKCIQRFTIGCEAKSTPYVLQYLAKDGQFETINFPKISEINNQTVKTTYKRTPYALVANVNTYTTFTGQEITLSSNTQSRITLQTDWMTYEDIEAHKEIIDSPVVYIDYGSNIGLIPVQVETNSYKVLKQWNTGNPYFQITIRHGHTNNKQRG